MIRSILYLFAASIAAALAYLAYDGKIVAIIAAFHLTGILP